MMGWSFLLLWFALACISWMLLTALRKNSAPCRNVVDGRASVVISIFWPLIVGWLLLILLVEGALYLRRKFRRMVGWARWRRARS